MKGGYLATVVLTINCCYALAAPQVSGSVYCAGCSPITPEEDADIPQSRSLGDATKDVNSYFDDHHGHAQTSEDAANVPAKLLPSGKYSFGYIIPPNTRASMPEQDVKVSNNGDGAYDVQIVSKPLVRTEDDDTVVITAEDEVQNVEMEKDDKNGVREDLDRAEIPAYLSYTGPNGEPYYVTGLFRQSQANLPVSLKAAILGAIPVAAVHDAQNVNKNPADNKFTKSTVPVYVEDPLNIKPENVQYNSNGAAPEDITGTNPVSDASKVVNSGYQYVVYNPYSFATSTSVSSQLTRGSGGNGFSQVVYYPPVQTYVPLGHPYYVSPFFK